MALALDNDDWLILDNQTKYKYMRIKSDFELIHLQKATHLSLII